MKLKYRVKGEEKYIISEIDNKLSPDISIMIDGFVVFCSVDLDVENINLDFTHDKE